MIPDATFKKRDYSIVCNSNASVRLAIDPGNLNGKAYLKLASNACTFQGNADTLEVSFSKDSKEVKFNFTITCNRPDDYYTRFFAWAENADGKSIEDMATVSIDCD